MTNEELIREARKRFKKLHIDSGDRRSAFIEDMKFAHNLEEGQWDEGDVSDRTKKERPYLTSNKLSKFVAQVVNQERANIDKDAIIPVDDKGDIQIASAYNELIRDIEYRSEFDEIRSLSGEHAVSGGFGYWRILTRYTDDGFDQEVFLNGIENPLLVELDPRGMYGFIREGIYIDEFREKYPGKKDFSDFEDAGDNELWYEDDRVFIAEYFRKVPYTKKIVEVYKPESNETAILEVTKDNEDEIRKMDVIRTREMRSYKVEWYKISGIEVLDKKEWVGSEIPIIEVVGHKLNLEGKIYTKSLIRDAKDPQRMYNYWLTSMTEKVALAPKAPYMVTPRQIEGYEPEWQQANIDNLPYLLYNPDGAAGGPPQRMPAPEIDVGAMTMLNIANADIMDVMGTYEASKGQTSNERSGKAILARAARSDLGTYNFPDNLRKATVKTKKMLIDIIPKIYDNARIIRLRNKDAQIEINFPVLDDNGNKILVNDLSKGRYDIRSNIQGHPSRRQETLDFIRELMQYSPPAYHDILLQLAMKYSDIEGAEEVMLAIQERTDMLQRQAQQEAMSKGNTIM